MSKDFHLGYSRLHTFFSCPKQYYYNYVLGRRYPAGPAMRRGTAYHECVETLLKYKMHYDKVFPFDKIEELCNKACAKENLTPSDTAKVIAATAFYHCEYYRKQNPIGVEVDFSFNLAGTDYTGRIDQIQDIGDGKAIVIDHKFSYDIWADARAKFGVQPVIYQLAAIKQLEAEIGFEYAGFEYNIIRIYPTPIIQQIFIPPLKEADVFWWQQQIEETSQAIQAGFFPAYPRDKECTWCSYKQECNPVIYHTQIDTHGVKTMEDVE